MNVLKIIGAIVLGAIVGSCVNMAIIMLSSAIHGQIDTNDPEAMKAHMEKLPPSGFALVILAHGGGTLVGAWVARRIAPDRNIWAAIVVTALFIAGGIAALNMIPSPPWFWVADLACYPICGYIGAWLARKT